MKLSSIMLLMVLSSCIAQLDSDSRHSPIGAERAISIAKQEIVRRKLPLPSNYRVEVSESTVISELQPDIPVYVISFNDPDRRRRLPAYEVNVIRDTGQVHAFGDFRTKGR